jgi:hypothetical protein
MVRRSYTFGQGSCSAGVSAEERRHKDAPRMSRRIHIKAGIKQLIPEYDTISAQSE